MSHRRGAAYAFPRPGAAPWVPVRGRPRAPLCGVGSVYPRPVTVNIWEELSHAMYQSPFASPLRCMHASMFTALAEAYSSQMQTMHEPYVLHEKQYASLYGISLVHRGYGY